MMEQAHPRDRHARQSDISIWRFPDVTYAPGTEIVALPNDVTLCPCDEMAAGARGEVALHPCLGADPKVVLRAGMGHCQRGIYGRVVTEVIANRDISPADVGYYRSGRR